MSSAELRRSGDHARRRRPGGSSSSVPGCSTVVLRAGPAAAAARATRSFDRGRFGGIVYELTGDNFTRAFDPPYRNVLVSSLGSPAITTVIALLIGYPVAYAIAQLPRQLETIALVADRAAVLDQLPDPHLRLDRAAQRPRAVTQRS